MDTQAGQDGGGVNIYGKGRSFLGRTGPFDDRVLVEHLPTTVEQLTQDQTVHAFGDLGSGNGRLAARHYEVLRRGSNCTRAVLSDPSARHRKLIAANPTFSSGMNTGEVQVMDVDLLCNFPKQFGGFQLVTCISVLMHITDDHIDDVSRRIVQAVERGGLLVVVTKTPGVAQACYDPIGNSTFRIPETNIIETYRGSENYQQIFEASGARVIASSSLPISPVNGSAVPSDYQCIEGQPLWDVLVMRSER